MSNLTVPTDSILTKGAPERKIKVPVKAAKTFYRGGAAVVELGVGYATNPANAATELLLGFCSDLKIDNSAGASADKYVTLEQPDLVKCTVSGVAVTDIGKPVFLSDDNIQTLTANNNYLGRLLYVDADGVYWVQVQYGFGMRAGAAGAAVVTTGSTNSSPYGFATAAQGDAIVTLVNEMRAALIAARIIKGAA